MAEQVRRTAREQQREVRVLMDLGGPKLRTGETAPAPSVVKLKPERDMQGVVLEPARVKLYSHRNPSSPDGEIHCISIDPVCIEQLRPGDTLSLVDARGSKRALHVLEVTGDVDIAETHRTIYITPRTHLRRTRKGDGPRSTLVRSVPEKLGTLLLRVGALLRLSASGLAQPDGDDSVAVGPHVASIACTLPEVLGQVRTGERIFFDDGHIGGIIRGTTPGELVVQIVDAKPNGSRLASDKGISLSGSNLNLPALTRQDLENLDAVARHADLVGLSFVQRSGDIDALRAHLKALNAERLEDRNARSVRAHSRFERLTHEGPRLCRGIVTHPG